MMTVMTTITRTMMCDHNDGDNDGGNHDGIL